MCSGPYRYPSPEKKVYSTSLGSFFFFRIRLSAPSILSMESPASVAEPSKDGKSLRISSTISLSLNQTKLSKTQGIACCLAISASPIDMEAPCPRAVGESSEGQTCVSAPVFACESDTWQTRGSAPTV